MVSAVRCSMFAASSASVKPIDHSTIRSLTKRLGSIHTESTQHHVSKTMSCHLWPHFCSKMESKIKRNGKNDNSVVKASLTEGDREMLPTFPNDFPV